jgi:hypothetical protein
MGTIAASFHTVGKYCCVKLRLNICLKIGIKMSEQPFMINPGISSSPTELEDFSLLMALQTSASEIGARDKNSEDCARGEKRIAPEGNNNNNNNNNNNKNNYVDDENTIML